MFVLEKCDPLQKLLQWYNFTGNASCLIVTIKIQFYISTWNKTTPTETVEECVLFTLCTGWEQSWTRSCYLPECLSVHTVCTVVYGMVYSFRNFALSFGRKHQHLLYTVHILYIVCVYMIYHFHYVGSACSYQVSWDVNEKRSRLIASNRLGR